MTDATMSSVTAPPSAPPGRRGPVGSILVHAALIAASIAMVYPLLWMISASVRPEDEIFASTSLWPSSVDFASYVRGWFGLDVSFGRFFWNSLVVAVLTVIGNVVGSARAAEGVERRR